jgi:hypothetical protein
MRYSHFATRNRAFLRPDSAVLSRFSFACLAERKCTMKLAIIASVLIAGIGAAEAQTQGYGALPNGFNSTWNNQPQPQRFGGPNPFGNYDVYNSQGQQMDTYQPRLGGGYTFNPDPGNDVMGISHGQLRISADNSVIDTTGGPEWSSPG